MAATETYIPGRLYEMPLALLQVDPNQPRKCIDPATLAELTVSIRRTRGSAPRYVENDIVPAELVGSVKGEI